jgi:hypothetical protein
MATYLELRNLYAHGDLVNRVEVACIVAAEKIRVESDATANHANRALWAKETFGDTRGVASKMLMAVLAANRTLTVAQLVGATDDAIQTAVDNAVNIFATGS